MADTSVYDPIVAAAAAAFAVPAEWIKAVIGAETSFSTPAPDTWESRAGEYSYGPMQVLLSTARRLGFPGTAANLADPAGNIPVGALDLASLRNRFGDDFRLVYSAYNSGDPNAWQTSAQVAANVQRALTWLNQFGGSVHSFSDSGDSPSLETVPDPGTISTGGVIAIGGLVAWWLSQRKG